MSPIAPYVPVLSYNLQAVTTSSQNTTTHNIKPSTINTEYQDNCLPVLQNWTACAWDCIQYVIDTMQHAGNWSYQLDNNQNLQCVKFSTCFSLNDLFCFLWTAFLRTDMVKALFLIFSCTPQNNSGLGQHPNRNLTTMWVDPLHLAVQGVTIPNIHWGISDLVGCAGMWVEPFLLKTVLLPSFSSGLAIWKQTNLMLPVLYNPISLL